MRSLGLNASDAEVADMINEIDLDQNGTLDLDGTYICAKTRFCDTENLHRIHQDDDDGCQAC